MSRLLHSKKRKIIGLEQNLTLQFSLVLPIFWVIWDKKMMFEELSYLLNISHLGLWYMPLKWNFLNFDQTQISGQKSFIHT